jgi:hypothetical protein
MTTEPVQKCAKPSKSKKPDYIAAIIVNAALLIIANQVLNWGILPFLTQDFKQMLPIIYIGGGVTIASNAAFLFYDRQWFTSACKIVINAVGIAILTRYLSVFPFDFAAYHGFNWAVFTRVAFYIGLAGLIVAIILEFIQMIVSLVKGK